MDCLTFIAEILKILIWPIIVIVIVILLRKNLINLLAELRYIRFKDLEIEFYKELEKANKRVEKANLPKFESIKDLEDRYDYLNKIAYSSSRGAILEAWILIENQLNEIVQKKFGGISAKYPTIMMIDLLFKEKIISKEVLSIFKELRIIRNKAVHDERFDIGISQANEFINMSLRLLAYLKNINK